MTSKKDAYMYLSMIVVFWLGGGLTGAIIVLIIATLKGWC